MKSVHHVAFGCKDRSELERFYTEVFGFRRAKTFNPGKPEEFVMLRLAETCIELFPILGNPEPMAPHSENRPGFRHMAYSVENLEETREVLRSWNLEIEDIIDCGKEVEGLRICFFRDPEGNLVEIMEGWNEE